MRAEGIKRSGDHSQPSRLQAKKGARNGWQLDNHWGYPIWTVKIRRSPLWLVASGKGNRALDEKLGAILE